MPKLIAKSGTAFGPLGCSRLLVTDVLHPGRGLTR